MVGKRASVSHRRSSQGNARRVRSLHEDSTHVDAAPPPLLSSSRVSSYFKALGAAWGPYSVWTHIYGRVVLGGCFVALGLAWWLMLHLHGIHIEAQSTTTAPAAKTTAKPRDIISYIPLEDDTQITPELVDRLNNLIQFRQPDDSNLTPHEVMKNRVRDLQYMFEGLEQMVEPSQWVQLTSFGPSGLVISHAIEARRKEHHTKKPYHVVTVDTLHLFPASAAFVKDWSDERRRNNTAVVHTYAPRGVALNATDDAGVSRMAFADLFGDRLWDREPDLYGYLVKAEPVARAARDMPNVIVWITGRRSTQGYARATLRPWELYSVPEFEGRQSDDTYRPTGASRALLKLNPLCWWTEKQVWDYIRILGIEYNELYDEGYRSIGDVHSTHKSTSKDGERAGRFIPSSEPSSNAGGAPQAESTTSHSHANGNEKECGMHTKVPAGATAGAAAERMEWRRRVAIEEAARGGLASIAGFHG